ncbi:hypothetical protein ACIQ4Z_10080 [Peribacillus asahii]|uniref:hypothetical protein n=1 Tax=Peribacillus asahii TaxID=228899 RepID=UPI00380BF94C
MSRKHRIWFPGAIYHITARGNRRATLFMYYDDYVTYLAILEDVLPYDQRHTPLTQDEQIPY